MNRYSGMVHPPVDFSARVNDGVTSNALGSVAIVPSLARHHHVVLANSETRIDGELARDQLVVGRDVHARDLAATHVQADCLREPRYGSPDSPIMSTCGSPLPVTRARPVRRDGVSRAGCLPGVQPAAPPQERMRGWGRPGDLRSPEDAVPTGLWQDSV